MMAVNASKPFSLPSAGGVVSLLNEGDKSTQRDTQSRGHERMSSRDGQHESSSSKAGDRLSARLEHARFLAPRRSSSSATVSTELSKSPSPYFDAGRLNEQDNASSHHSAPQSTESSTDGSLDSQKRLPSMQMQSNDSWRSARFASHSSDSSLQSDDEGPAQSPKRRRGEESGEGSHILDHARFARSPMPLDGGRTATNSAASVPTNMRQATDIHHTEAESRHVRRDEDNRMERSGSSSSTSGSARRNSTASRVIGGKKRYPCTHPGCGKTFSTSGHAARHNRIHTGSKPYRCTFPGCSASFSRQDNSLQHYRTHVLHPKGRNGTGVDGSFTEAVPYDGDLHSLDPETVASVRLGRKALEEGTAIAVVQEYVDTNGRRGEAIQRMVGQPRSGRRGSTTSTSGDWAAGDRRMSLDGPAAPFHGAAAMPYHGAPQSLPAQHYADYPRAASGAIAPPYGADNRQRESHPSRSDVYASPPGYAGAYHPCASRVVHPYDESDHPRHFAPSRSEAMPPARYSDRCAHEGGLGPAPPLEPAQRQFAHSRRASLTTAQQYSNYHPQANAYHAPSREAAMDVDAPHVREGSGHRRVISGASGSASHAPPSPTGLVSPVQRALSQQGYQAPSRRREMPPARSQEGLSLLLSAATSSPEIVAHGGRERTVSELGRRHIGGVPAGNTLAAMSIQGPPMPATTSPSMQARKLNGGDVLRLPLPATSKMPYSSDRSTTMAPVKPNALATPPRYNDASDRWGASRSMVRPGAVQLPPLRDAVAGDGL